MEGFSSYQSSDSGDGGSKLQKLSHGIGSNIQKISQNVKSMQQLVNQLGTDQDNQQLRSQLHQVRHYTSCLAKDTTTELRNFQHAQVPLGEDQRAWRIQAERLTKEFTQALNEFQAAQRLAASKEKESLKKARADSDAHFFDDRSGSALLDLNGEEKGRGGGGFGGNKMNQVQIQMEQEAEMQALQERESQIRKLESDIMDVNQIFKDLGTMIHEQGGMVDSIEANVENAQVHVSQGNTELSRARQYQERKKILLTYLRHPFSSFRQLFSSSGVRTEVQYQHDLAVAKTRARKKKLCLILTSVIVLSIILGLIIWSSSSD